MLKLILAVLGIFGKILARILTKRAKLKSAAEVLPEESPTAQAVEEAETKAKEKFGPRRTHQPRKTLVEGVVREVESASPKS